MTNYMTYWVDFSRPKSRSPIDDLYTAETRRTLATCATASSAAKQRPPVRLRQQQQMTQNVAGNFSNSATMSPTSNRSRSYHSLTSHNISSLKKNSMPAGRSALKPATSDTELSRRSASPYGAHFRETSSPPSSSYPPDYNGYSGSKSFTSSIVRQSSMQPVALSPRLARRSLTALNRLTQIAQEGRKKLEASTVNTKTSGSATLRRTGTFTKEDDITGRVVRRSALSSSTSRQRPASIAAPGLWRGSYAK